MFIKQVLKPRGFEVDDLERFVRHYLGVQELIATVGLSGKLVTPQEFAGPVTSASMRKWLPQPCSSPPPITWPASPRRPTQ